MASPLPPDPYAALGVSKGASAGEIKKAHRLLVLKYHPDKLCNAAEEEKEAASNRFVLIQTSYEILSEPARRERYDAQVRLAELRKEAITRQSEDHNSRSREADTRSAPSPYRSQEAPRGAYAARPEPRMTPQYEERRPSYAAADYFDSQPRSTMRKEPEYERPSRRSAPETKEKSRTSARSTKDNERERRREKTRQTERDTRRERERKYTPYVEEDSESDSDEYERRARKMREEDGEQRRAKEAYYAQMHRQRKEAEDGNYDERTRKMFAQTADVRDYIARGGVRQRPEPERRPSPVRMSSSKDKVEYLRRGGDGRAPAMVRRSSEKPEKSKKESSKDKESSKKTSSRTPERRSSAENMEERQPPNLKSAKSSPADIRVPSEKQRAASLQPGTDAMPIPSVKRSETMPTQQSSRRSENTVPKASGLRATEFNEGVPTPATTPEYQQGSSASKYHYGKQYADDDEYATPDGYRTELREPAGATQRPRYTRKITRSPSPVKDSREPTPREPVRETREPLRESREPARESREPSRETREMRDPRANTHRTTSARYPSTQPQPPPPNTRTTSYVYNGRSGVDRFDGSGSRPGSGREPSPRDQNYKYEKPLFGEIGADSRPASGSPRQRYGPCGPPDEGTSYPKTYRPEEIRVQSGYNVKRSERPERPVLSRHGSSNGPYSQAQPIRVP